MNTAVVNLIMSTPWVRQCGKDASTCLQSAHAKPVNHLSCWASPRWPMTLFQDEDKLWELRAHFEKISTVT